MRGNTRAGRVFPRDLDLSATLEDEDLTLSYLYLLDEYGAGEFLVSRREAAM